MIKTILLRKFKKAFTMLELVMVIVILGIVSSIASTVISDIYQNYLLQRATYRASIKTELAAIQIANLLSYRLKHTTLAKNPSDLTDFVTVTDPTMMTDNRHTILEWIGYDHDSFEAALLPGWNGFCDVNASLTGSNIVTPGSDLALTETIMRNLTRNDVPTTHKPAIFFNDYLYRFSPDTPYNVKCMGMIDTNTSCISSIDFTTSEQMDFNLNSSLPNKRIAEHYKLAASAYALWPVPNPDTGNFDLRLYYNYQPWAGELLAEPNQYNILIKNITVFKFAESADTFRFKICAQENIGSDYNITICKEKAIIL